MDFKSLGKNKWFLIVGAIGVICLLFGSFLSGAVKPTLGTVSQSSGDGTTTTAPSGFSDLSEQLAFSYETQYDKQLQSILAQISGIYQVNVMVTVDSTETLKLANNDQQTTSTQKNGATTSTTTNNNQQIFTVHNADGSETPVVVERVQPDVRGVLVTVAANDFVVAKAEIINAIQNVLDVPAYKISVEPQKGNE